jgi:hypothetical protein
MITTTLRATALTAAVFSLAGLNLSPEDKRALIAFLRTL